MAEAKSTQAEQSPLEDTEFDIARTFTLLLVTLVLPIYLAISVISYSLAAIY